MSYRPVSELTPEELRYRRAWGRAKYAAYKARRDATPTRQQRKQQLLLERRLARVESRTSKEWRAAVKAKQRLESGFRHEVSLHRLYERWQDWQTAERLLYLKSVREGAI